MATPKADDAVYKTVDPIVGTTAADEQTLASPSRQRRDDEELWNGIVNRLIDWGTERANLAAEGICPPTAQSIGRACECVRALRDDGKHVPQAVVPNGEGGIVFEMEEGTVYSTLEIQADGSVEAIDYMDRRIIHREAFD